MNDNTLFSPRMLLGGIAAMVLIFAASAYFFLHANEDLGTERAGANSYSRSAIGYAGIVEVLRRSGVSVTQSRGDTLAKVSQRGLLVLAEPRLTPPAMARLTPLMTANTVLLILPKWDALADGHRPEWIGKVARDQVEGPAILGYAVRPARVLRATKGRSWSIDRIGHAPDPLADGQLVEAHDLTPVVGNEQGMLLGEVVRNNRRIWVLADPDVINNHSLANPANTGFALALINRLRGDGPVVFDETIHGFLVENASPFVLLFRPPFVYTTLLVFLTLALLLWATMRRFGAALPAAVPLEGGKLGLLHTAAGLLEFAGYQRSTTRRYVRLSIADVARRLRAPPAMAEVHLVAWLDAVAGSRGLTVRCQPLYERAQLLSEAPGGEIGPLLRLARDTHRWKGEIIHGPARRPRRR